MQRWTEGRAPAVWFEPLPTLPAASTVAQRLRDAQCPKAVALVGFEHDFEASEAARRLPYGLRGEGIEEIVFTRTVSGGPLVEFDDDAWPGEDRTFVQDDLDAAIDLVIDFAIEYDPEGAIVVVTGDARFVELVARRLHER